MTTSFTTRIRRWDTGKLMRAKDAAMAKSNIRITLSIEKSMHIADVYIEINGDELQVSAFKEWVQTFALQTPV
jgi:ribosome-associated translation inhibitor RaiA